MLGLTVHRLSKEVIRMEKGKKKNKTPKKKVTQVAPKKDGAGSSDVQPALPTPKRKGKPSSKNKGK